MTTRMNSVIAGCAVIFGMIALPANQTVFANETNSQRQIHLKARFIEVSKKSFIAMPQLLSNAVAGPMTGILSDAEFRTMLQALENQTGVNSLAEPECVTISGRPAQMRVTDIREIQVGFAPRGDSDSGTAPLNQADKIAIGPRADVVPSILLDGYTIHLMAMASVSEVATDGKETTAKPVAGTQHAGATVNLWDGQTLVLGPLDEVIALWHGQTLRRITPDQDAGKKPGNSDKEFFTFITATIVDPAGNRVHSDDEIRQLQAKTKSAFPPQPQLSTPSQ